MEKILGYCGYRCDICPAYQKNISKVDLAYISDKWFEYFGLRIPPEDIMCVGCKNEGKHPDSECPVRPCAMERGVEYCADCESFGCDSMNSRADFIENNIKDIASIPEQDYKLIIEPYLGKKRLLELRNKS